MILTEEARQLNDMYDYIKSECKRLKVRQKHLAYELGVSQPAVSHLIHDQKLSLEQYVYILCLLRRKERELKCTH